MKEEENKVGYLKFPQTRRHLKGRSKNKRYNTNKKRQKRKKDGKRLKKIAAQSRKQKT